MKITDTRLVHGCAIRVTALGLGSAPLGGLYTPVSTADAQATLQCAWDLGLRYFDTAPMYGNGRAEHLVGHVLRENAADARAYTLSTKVGRLMANRRPGLNLAHPAPKNPLDPGWQNGLPFTEVFDYSYDGIMRSFDDSQQRTGLNKIDILYVHDIGRLTHPEQYALHWAALTTGGGFRALTELRSAGLIAAFGLGVNECEVIRDALNEADLNCCLLAGRYTLLEQTAADTGLLDLALARKVSLVIGGVFNSGILAARPGEPQMYNYAQAPRQVIDQVRQLHDFSRDTGVPLPALAMQYPLRHPAVTSVLIGANSADQLRHNVAMFEQEFPEAVWAELDSVLPQLSAN